jgi:hypothetical protein
MQALNYAFGVLMPMRADKRDELPDWLPPKIEELPADEAQQIVEGISPSRSLSRSNQRTSGRPDE